MFAHEIFVLDQSSLERLKNNTSPAQRFRKGIALEQLIVRENQTPRFAVEHRRSLQDFSLLIVRRCITESIGRKIKGIDVGKSPGLIFARRIGHRGKFAPALFPLLPKPQGDSTGILLRRGDNSGIYGRRLCHFLKDSSSVAHFARPKMRGKLNYPTEPSISSSIKRLSSTEYSIGNWRTRSLMNPFTLRLMAWASLRPRCCM